MKTLKEICELMCSTDYKDRFIAEYEQLFCRLTSLVIMREKMDHGTLKFTPTCPGSLYDLQIRAMKDYLTVLEARAVIEGIDLHKDEQGGVDVKID